MILKENDTLILRGLKGGYRERIACEKELYLQYSYFIDEGCKKYGLIYEDSFSAYSDAVLGAIHNIVSEKFEARASLKTYLFEIYFNKCVDLLKKNETNKERVNNSIDFPELIAQLPDGARNSVEKMIDKQTGLVVKRQLETMGEKCKQILLLFEDQFTDKQIAEQLQYNSTAVAKITRIRCLERLKERVTRALKDV